MKPLYLFWGKVRTGRKRGRELGFPTANIGLSQHITSGIYVSLVKTKKVQYKALTFIGDAKTFGEKLYQSETYILDFAGNLYGAYLTIRLLKKLRENKKFKNSKQLIKHMKEDEKKAREYLDLMRS